MRLPPVPRSVFLGAPGVRYDCWAPPPELAPWVAGIWRVRAGARHLLRVLPDGCMDLIRGEVIGPSTEPVLVRLDPGDEALGIRLRPGAFTALFGVPADELVGLRLALADVVGAPRGLLSAARDAAPPDPAAGLALAGASVGALSRELAYSERQLRRRVERATGLGPKRLARIGRMQALLAAGRGESWARTAADHGFFDEAHMVNDVRALAGATPHALLG